MNLHHVVGRRKPPALSPKEYPHGLLLDLLQSPLRVSDIGLIQFCLDCVLFCQDISPDLAMWALAAEACGPIDQSEPNWPTSHTERLQSNTCFILPLIRLIVADFCYTTNAVMLWLTVSWPHTQCLEERENEAQQRNNRLKGCIMKLCPKNYLDP